MLVRVGGAVFDDGVGAVTQVEHVGVAGVLVEVAGGDQGVVARAADEGAMATEPVMAVTALQQIEADAVLQHVIARTAGQGVVAAATGQGVVAAGADDTVAGDGSRVGGVAGNGQENLVGDGVVHGDPRGISMGRFTRNEPPGFGSEIHKDINEFQ